MIRFADMETGYIQLEMYDRDNLLYYFLNNINNRGEADIVLVYDQDEYYGLATYDSILNRYGNDGIINLKYNVRPENDIFEDLQNLFDKEAEIIKSVVWIRVFDINMALVYFAYDDIWSVDIRIMQSALSFFEHNKECLFINELYPNIEKVCIYDFNELAFRFYKILKRKNISVEVFGEKWSILFPDIYVSQQSGSESVLTEKVMNVYAEGTAIQKKRIEKGVGYWFGGGEWSFILDIMRANYFHRANLLKKELCEKNILTKTMIFPAFEELNFYTIDEYYRHQVGLTNEFPVELLKKKQAIIVQQVKKCWAKNSMDKFEDAISVAKRRNRSYRMIGNEGVSWKCFGGGKHVLYLIGPCIVEGSFVDEEDSFAAKMYEEISALRKDYTVITIGISGWDVVMLEKVIYSLTLYEGDMVIMISNNKIGMMKYKDENYPGDIDVKTILDKRQDDWFWNMPIHTNQRGNAKIANAVVNEYLSDHLSKLIKYENVLAMRQLGKCFLPMNIEEELNNYIDKITVESIYTENIGAIVMNCNPMTNGHLYLIEQALKSVDLLYIFLVEEDKSEFSFADRKTMVQSVLEGYENIKVVPSGRFILSYDTMPIYFEKAEKQEEIVDASHDLQLFGEKIACRLGVKKRFVGEEPNDNVTRQYNEAMKRILPAYGIQVIEMPRLKCNNRVISASVVRKCLNSGNTEMVKEYVPYNVYMFLKNKSMV